MKRRKFLKGAAVAGAATPIITKQGWSVDNPDNLELESKEAKTNLLAAFGTLNTASHPMIDAFACCSFINRENSGGTSATQNIP